MAPAFSFRRWGRPAVVAAAALLIGWNIHRSAAGGAGRFIEHPVSAAEVDGGGGLILRPETGRPRTVALLGIRPRAGHEADYLAEIRSRVAGGKIRLTFPVDPAADSPLKAYVYLGDGVMLNEWLVITGLAAADGSHHPLGDWFARQQRKAAWRPAKRAAAGA